MATKSDFAQKLLHDLRVRKERMASAQNSSRQSTQTTGVAHGNARRTSRGSRQINTLESAGSRSGNTSRMSNTGNNNRPTNTKESSNQIVLYGNSQTSKQQVRDLSTIIAFAFQNNGNLTNIRASTTNPLVNFFNQTFGRKPRDTHKTDITSFEDRNFPTGQFSNIHITEVSKGVQKLNNILRACSNGFTFETSSIEVGKELLKGAIDLEESLRMLVNFQEASQYGNTTQKKSRLKLVEEDEDDQHKNAKIAEQWKLDRPKFSFDKPSKNSRVVQNATRGEDSSLSTQVVAHKRSTSYVQDSNLPTQVRENNNNSSSSQLKQDKRRISNVVAKLMGLEEIPQKDFIHEKSDSNGKQGNISKQNTNLSESLDTTSSDQEISHPIVGDSKRKQNPTEDKRSKIIKSDDKMQILNTEVQQKAETSKTQNRIGYKSGENAIETRKADKELPINRQKPEEKRVLLQEHVLKRGEHSQDKSRKDKKFQHFQKQNLMAGRNHDGRHVESMIPSKSKKSTATNLQYKLSRENLEPDNKRSTKSTQKVPINDPPKRKHQDDAHNKEKIKKQDQIHDSSAKESQFDMEKESGPTKEETIEVSAKQKTVGPKKVRISEIPQKIDVLMSRRNANVNHLRRSVKQPANLLKDLKQQMDNKNRNSKRTEEQRDAEVNGEMTIETVKQHEKLQNEDVFSIKWNTSVADEYQIQNTQNTRNLKDDCKAIALNAGTIADDLPTVEQPCALKDEQELKQCDQSIGDHEEESTELYNLSQHKNKQIPATKKQEQLSLTEPEKHLKEIIIKSQIFLSTAEALFKLNIPVSFLHAAEQDYEVAGKNKLVLNCAYEVMKRKARRHENLHHYPYTKTGISRIKVRSLDDLIKQVCKDLEMIKFYGGNVSDECDVAEKLHKMLDKDIYDKGPNVNSMWDFEWSNITSLTLEKEDIVRDVERYMLNGLLDEITNDLVVSTVSV